MGTEEIEGIVDDLRSGYDGDPWHGPSLRKVLDGVSAATASARPIPGGHSIWEIVAHLAAWDGVVARRIEEHRAIESPDEGDFPSITDAGNDAWQAALNLLDARHKKLVEIVSGLDLARWLEPVAGKEYNVAHMVRGVPQHMAYHAGQIALIRKLVEAKAPRAGV
jgi:hypothetical protein